MFILTYLFKNSQQAIQLHFDKLQSAIDGMNRTGNIHDDYGCIAYIDRASVGAYYVTDLEKELEAQEKSELMKARAMMRAQNKAKSDPGLMILGGSNNAIGKRQ